MPEVTVQEMAEEIARETTSCPEGKGPRLPACITTSCPYCWQLAPEAEIRRKYAEMKEGEK